MKSKKLPGYCAAAVAAILTATNITGQSLLPRAPGAVVVNISSPPGRPSEPGIAINPRNPKQVVAVYQTPASAAYSIDAGRTFALAEGTKPADWRVAGDVSTTFDNRGNAYLCYLAFDHLGTTAYWAHSAGRNGIFVRRSADGGKIWAKQAVAVKAFVTGHERGLQFEDEPRIFADNGSRSRYAGNLYVGWVEWQLDKSVMLFSRSTDAGVTWSTPVQISTHPGLPRDDNGSLGGFVQAITPDGVIYAIWNDGNSIVLTKSSNGGQTFSRPKKAIETAPPYFGEVPGVSRVQGSPQIAVDSRNKKTPRLYITWSDYRNGDVDVFLAVSSDGGRKWSQPIRVNSDPIHDGNDQFYQWMAVDPVTGDIYVQFYDRRDDPQNRKTCVTLTRSTDSGKTFANYAWTDTCFEGRQAFLGDYTWLVAYNRHVYGAWTEAAPPPPNAGNATSVSRSRGASPEGVDTIVRVGTADFSGVK